MAEAKSPEPLELLDVAKRSAAAGAAVLSRRSEGSLNAVNKGAAGDWVTSFDTDAECAVREVIRNLRPFDAVTGEELAASISAEPSGIRWSVDPLDGTTNFIRNLPYFATSVAAVNSDGEWLAGVVHAPALDRVYWAARGHGAWLSERGNVRQLAGPDRGRIGKVLGTGFSYDEATRTKQYTSLTDMMDGFADLRRLGSAALDLCLVAEGALDAYAERGLHEHDFAAGALIAEEAGVTVHRPGTAGDRMDDAERLASVTTAWAVEPAGIKEALGI